jgi:hypothetical protein
MLAEACLVLYLEANTPLVTCIYSVKSLIFSSESGDAYWTTPVRNVVDRAHLSSVCHLLLLISIRHYSRW